MLVCVSRHSNRREFAKGESRSSCTCLPESMTVRLKLRLASFGLKVADDKSTRGSLISFVHKVAEEIHWRVPHPEVRWGQIFVGVAAWFMAAFCSAEAYWPIYPNPIRAIKILLTMFSRTLLWKEIISSVASTSSSSSIVVKSISEIFFLLFFPFLLWFFFLSKFFLFHFVYFFIVTFLRLFFFLSRSFLNFGAHQAWESVTRTLLRL